ncbi:hypothetical protein ACN47E_000805 [Coniothyrium glycines]
MSTHSSPGPCVVDASSKPRPKLLAALRNPTTDSSDSDSESDSDGSNSAAGSLPMCASTKPASSEQTPGALEPNEEEEDDDESDGGAAYERMKKRLAASKSGTANKEPPASAAIESSAEKDGMPIRSTTRMLDPQRATTTFPHTSPSPPVQSRQSSPGLFVTPSPSPLKRTISRTVNEGSESDGSTQSSHDAELQKRVRRIRAQRLARKQEERTQTARTTKYGEQRKQRGSDSDTDGESGRRLTQQAKPTRKAGKKAMEAMARDQQRISRNMQLTHQAKTKKRFTTQDLLTRFGFNLPNDGITSLPTPDASSNLNSSDAEAAHVQATSPSSTIRTVEEAVSSTSLLGAAASMPAEAEQAHPEGATTTLEKGHGSVSEPTRLSAHLRRTTPISIRNAMVELSDSDDEVQVTQPKSRFPVFDRVPTKHENESTSLLRLRALAQLAKSPQQSKKGRRHVSLAEMEFSLVQKARQQANEARQEKIADLIRRGHHIETEEEREKRETEIEDMVAHFEKQKEEDRQLAKLEREERKKNGEPLDDLPSSDEEDGEYVGSDDDNTPVEDDEHGLDTELELSGSEDDLSDADVGDNAAEEQDDHVEDESTGKLDETQPQSEEQQAEVGLEKDEDDESAPARTRIGQRHRNRVVVDEDDSDDEDPKPASSTQIASEEDAMAVFGFDDANVGVGFTQMFAGTMAELESRSSSAFVTMPEQEQDSLDFLRGLPDTQPGANFSQADDFMIPNSQLLRSPQKESQGNADDQFSLGISQLVKTSPAFSRTQIEEFEPTQDAGFSFSRSPAGLAPPSTTDTVMMSVAESPVHARKGRLQRRRREAAIELSDVEEDINQVPEDLTDEDDNIQLPPKPRDAFSRLQKGAQKQKAMDDFNKKTSMAKEAIMEQAEESEDEYAGLGGASDDEEGEEDQELKDMIDHNKVDVDERQIAAFYADKAKKEDEKNIAELYKRIQTGGLRKHAGGQGFDLSDSEDEAEMRQRKKRAEFQKQTNELLKDERVKEISKDERKKAFFNTLADFADEGDYDFLDMPVELSGPPGSLEQDGAEEDNATEEVIPDSQTTAISAPINPLKRKSPDSQKENRPPPHMRRTPASDDFTRKPITLVDIQNSVSELLEDSRMIIPDSQYSDAEEEEAESSYRPSRKASVIDRLTLSRSCTMEEVVGGDANMAFHAPSRATAAPGFRVPSLIRQATSNLSAGSQRSSGASTPTEGVVRRGGTGRSNIHAQAREAERRALLDKKEGKRKEALRRKVEGGRKRAGGIRSVLGDLGGGFE